MKSDEAHSDFIENAALYTLGALNDDEVRSFEEHLRKGCDICKAEVESFSEVVAALNFGVAEEAPSPELKQRLRLRLDEAKRGTNDKGSSVMMPSQFLSVRADEGGWVELLEGVLVKQLFVDNKTGLATSLVRMSPGTSLPRHRHSEVEQLYILEGDCRVHDEVLGPGDYHCASPGSIHATTYTINGTLFLLVAPEKYEVL